MEPAIIGGMLSEGSKFGILGLLLMLSLTGCGTLMVWWRDAERKCASLANELQEKRIAEKSETINVLHAGAQANQQLAASISVRTETLNNLINLITSSNARLEA